MGQICSGRKSKADFSEYGALNEALLKKDPSPLDFPLEGHPYMKKNCIKPKGYYQHGYYKLGSEKPKDVDRPIFEKPEPLDLLNKNWYYGPMTRTEAEEALNNRNNQPGAFLMRRSYRLDAYVVSVKYKDDIHGNPYVRHFNITDTQDECFFFAGMIFFKLSDLMEHFMTVLDIGLPKKICVRPAPTIKDVLRGAKGQWESLREEVRYVRSFGSSCMRRAED